MVQREDESYTGVHRRWLVLAAVGMGIAITTLDVGGINVSLHTLARYFNVDAGTAAWLPLLAFLTVTSTLLLFGRLSDVVGSKRIFAAGFAVYALASLASGFAPSFSVLLVARGFQAVGVSMLSANSPAILAECYPFHERGKAVGISSTLVAIGFFVGPIIAGFVIATLGWRWVFFSSVPICVAGFVLSSIVLPHSAPIKALRFDFLGAFLFAAGAVCLLLAVNGARSSSIGSPSVLLPGVGAVLATAAFIAVEGRVSEPMLEIGLFRSRLFSLSLLSSFAVFLGIAGQDMLAPLFIQQILLIDPATAGLAASTVPFIRIFTASPAGLFSDRFGSRWLSVAGCVLTGIGIFGLSRMDASTTLLWLVACLAIIGLGTGIFFSPNMHAIMASVPPSRLGVASGALGLRRNLGQSLAIALAAYLLQSGSGGAVATVPGFQLAFAAQAICLAIAVLAALMAGSTVSARQRVLAGRAAS